MKVEIELCELNELREAALSAESKQQASGGFGIGDYVLIRTYSAGVHVGNLLSLKESEVILTNARRIWRWAGAFTLSEVAQYGPQKPSECKFSCPVNKILLNAIEIIEVTQKARKIIDSIRDHQVMV